MHDNAANAVNGVSLTEWPHFGCVAHTLQLCIKTGLDISTISQMVAASRKLVGHFKHSVVAMTGLRDKQTQLNVAEHHLIQDVSTRWNSTYFMLDRLAEQQVAPYAVIHDAAITKPHHQYLDLKDTQWNLLTQMVVVLKPLQVATTVFSADLNLSCSIIYPVINGLLSNHLVVTADDLPSVKVFKDTVAKELNRRFTPFSTDTAKSLPVLCAAVDPRYSQLNFINEDQKAIVHEELISEMTLMQATSDDQSDEQPPAAKKSKKDSALYFLLGTSSEAEDHLTVNDELEYFLKEPAQDPDSDALQWWAKNHERFPTLSKLAKKLMCIPATSVPSERVFSTSGNIVTKLRSSLKPDNVNMLVFLNKNLPRL